MPSEIIRDEKFYMRFAIFLVEDTHFKVPNLVLEEESDVFKDMFTLPQLPGEEVEGQSDDKPIRLEGVKKDEFSSLLKLLYSNQWFVPLGFTPKEWLHILELSTMWEMKRVRSHAIAEIYTAQKGFPHTLINLGKKYRVDDWIFIGVEKLVRRVHPLNAEDVKLIGVDEVLKIASIRECCYSRTVVPQRHRADPSNILDSRIKAEYDLANIPAVKCRRDSGE